MDYRMMSPADIMNVPLGRWWLEMLFLSGVSPKHAPAHLRRNCRIFRDMGGKQEAYTISERYAKAGKIARGDRVKHSLLIGGSVGTGKTWLGTAVFKHMLWMSQAQHNTRKMFIWTTFSEMIRSIQGTYSDSSKSTDDILAYFRNANCLLIDDFGDMDDTDTSKDKRSLVYEIIDSRNSNQRETILTTNLELKEMRTKWGERIFERVAEMCRYIPMKGENMRHSKVSITDGERLITETLISMQGESVHFKSVPSNWYEETKIYDMEVS